MPNYFKLNYLEFCFSSVPVQQITVNSTLKMYNIRVIQAKFTAVSEDRSATKPLFGYESHKKYCSETPIP